MKTLSFPSLFVPLAVALLLGVSGCNLPASDPYYPPSGGYDRYPNSGYGGGYDRYSEERERERLREERRRLEYERERLEHERWESQHRAPPPVQWRPPPAPPAAVQEHCPSGYQPSERKCTPAERKRGCKDMRLKGGLGCVHRPR